MKGGKRTGAGRPPGSFENKSKKVPYSIKINPELLEKLRAHDLPAGKIIDRALRDWFDR